MLGVLDQILCWIEQFGALVADGAVWCFNLVIAALGAVVTGILTLLPAMPSAPTLPTEVTTIAGWVAWWIPVGTIFEIFTFLIGAFLVWLIVGMVLRWAKAIS